MYNMRGGRGGTTAVCTSTTANTPCPKIKHGKPSALTSQSWALSTFSRANNKALSGGGGSITVEVVVVQDIFLLGGGGGGQLKVPI